ncbi:radical SAM/SPASM domain protein, ACGX system [Methanobrevibacter sp.]|uniref:radical SAM/SPASM domain protein, ACGX system n=1 Tax=Methanobrevibacter sp. TaxID=66852 RepID=UPI00388EB1D3
MNDYFAFQWHILDDCDQRCKHCYIFSNQDEKLNQMSWQEMEIIFDKCLEFCDETSKKPYFAITGGDPILHPNFWQLLEKLNENNVSYSIMGNPFHLNDEVCKNLYELNCRQYQMSIDGLRKTHDYFRQPGSYDTTLEKIQTLRKAKIRTSIMTTVSKKNINLIPWIIDEVVRNKVDLYSFARYCPTSPKEDIIMPLEYKNLLEKVWQKYVEYKDSNTLFLFKDHLWTLFLYENGLFEIPRNLKKNIIYDGCNCGISHMTILPNADVYACRRMESKVGNALDGNLFSIFKSDDLNYFRQYENFEKCGGCELLRFCRGCPAVSHSYTSDMYSPDPQCWKN